MFKKAFLILSIAFSLSACSLVSANLQKTSPNVTASDNPSPSPEALVTTPEASPSFMIAPTNPNNRAQSNSITQATPENNQVVLPYDPNVQGRLIADPETFSQKLELLSKKFVKDQFETKEDFDRRITQEVKNFQEAESLKFKEVFVIENTFSSNDCTYNADDKILTIRNPTVLSFPDLTNIKVLPEKRNNPGRGQMGTKFILSFLSPESKAISDSDVTNYWLNKKNKIDTSSDEIVISNLDPSYAKQLVTENRLVLTTYLTLPLFSKDKF